MAATQPVRRNSPAAALRRNAALLCFLIFAWMAAAPVAPAFAAVKFPQLTGRVVDDAHVLSPEAVGTLTSELQSLETATTKQLVVVTVPSLQGLSIEDYGVQLGRNWKIGRKGKNNGVLLIVAPNDRKVRIEVGYGLEGDITDATSSQIIHDVILPDFRTGHMENGILGGTEALITAMGGGNAAALDLPPPATPAPGAGHSWKFGYSPGGTGHAWKIQYSHSSGGTVHSTPDYIFASLYAIFALSFLALLIKLNFFPSPAQKRFMDGIRTSNSRSSSSWSSSSSGSSSDSDSFSGGGGSFGGGGASGSW